MKAAVIVAFVLVQGSHSFVTHTTSVKNHLTLITKNQKVGTKCHATADEQLGESCRRKFLTKGGAAFLSTVLINGEVAVAEEDMTSRLFNSDGSLKDKNAEVEAKSRSVPVAFPSEKIDSAVLSLDGSSLVLPESQKTINVLFSLPGKWTDAPDYVDTSEGLNIKACDFVATYQLPGTYSYKVLDKAAMTGVAKAVGVNMLPASEIGFGPFTKNLLSADVISGKKISKPASSSDDEIDSRDYYEFDIAIAPKVCDDSSENLGLGFCPYEEIVLISATIVDGRMYVLGAKCKKDQWKRESADLKRVRGSFFVDSPL